MGGNLAQSLWRNAHLILAAYWQAYAPCTQKCIRCRLSLIRRASGLNKLATEDIVILTSWKHTPVQRLAWAIVQPCEEYRYVLRAYHRWEMPIFLHKLVWYSIFQNRFHFSWDLIPWSTAGILRPTRYETASHQIYPAEYVPPSLLIHIFQSNGTGNCCLGLIDTTVSATAACP